MIVIKNDGSTQNFDLMKIISVLHKANKRFEKEENYQSVSPQEIKELANKVSMAIQKDSIATKEIQDLVTEILINENYVKMAQSYIEGCYEKNWKRNMTELDKNVFSILKVENNEVGLENSHKNPMLATTQRDYMAGEVSKSIAERLLFDDDVVQAHKKGIIHIHDLDYIIQNITNCGLINLEDMFNNGTMIGNVRIDTPKSLRTATAVATQAAASIGSNQFGGMTLSLGHLAPYVEVSRQKYIKEVTEEQEETGTVNPDVISYIVEKRLMKEIKDSIQTLNYQLNSYTTTAGQTPFISIFIYLNECKNDREKEDLVLLSTELFKQRIKGLPNKDGVPITQTFPKLVYVLEEDNAREGSKYFELTKLAAKCTAKRLVPDYISEKVALKLKGVCVAPMGCRSFINVDYSDKTWGKFNMGVCSINLPHVALSSKGDPEEFWKILDERMNLVFKAQMTRYRKLLGTPAKIAPILWQNGAYARLGEDDVIDSILTKEYSTISVGYMGLHETVKYMTGKSITDESVKDFAKSVLKKMNQYCKQWVKETNLGWGIYGTPGESNTYKFAKACIRDFGTIDGENKRDYVTNSYHVHVTEPIDAFSKLKIENEYQELSTGGAISYIETPNLQDNISAILSVLEYIYDNIMYSELNCKSDLCSACGFDGELVGYTDGETFGWKCPECGNKDMSKLHVVRRVCGYLGCNMGGVGWNKGRFSDITERTLHL